MGFFNLQLFLFRHNENSENEIKSSNTKKWTIE